MSMLKALDYLLLLPEEISKHVSDMMYLMSKHIVVFSVPEDIEMCSCNDAWDSMPYKLIQVVKIVRYRKII